MGIVMVWVFAYYTVNNSEESDIPFQLPLIWVSFQSDCNEKRLNCAKQAL